MKQTAVEWLEKEIEKFHNWKLNPIFDENCFDEIELSKAIKQAKEMEKQQIVDFSEKHILENLTCNYNGEPISLKEAEQYYNEKFNK